MTIQVLYKENENFNIKPLIGLPLSTDIPLSIVPYQEYQFTQSYCMEHILKNEHTNLLFLLRSIYTKTW